MIFTVFCAPNDARMQRQAELLEFSWGSVRQPGELVRLTPSWSGEPAPQHRFARVVAANTFLPTGDIPMPKAFFAWREHSQKVADFNVGNIIAKGCVTPLSPEVRAAYDAPFPDDTFKEGARQFPMLVPATPDDPATPANRAAWERLAEWKKPFLTAFSDQDPITRGADVFLQAAIPGAEGRPHTTLSGGGHFLQEDCGPALARVVADFIAAT